MKSKKNLVSKQIMGIALASIMVLGGCANKVATSQEKPKDNRTFKIGINQLAEHPALDATREGFIEGLKEEGIPVEIDYKNAQGDIPNSNSISSKFVSDKVDLIFAIATASAQSSKQATTDIPILFSAVTDPVGSGLVTSLDAPGANVTGTSDKTPNKKQLELLKQIDPNIKKVGIIYNTSETNSVSQIEEITKIGKELNLEVVTVGVNNINDIPQATDAILSKSDAIYTITDNTVASAIGLIATKAIEQKKIVLGAEEAHVKAGALITDGISFKELGKQTAKMAASILKDGKKPNELKVESLSNTTKLINKKTIEALGLDQKLDVFKDATPIE